MHVKDILEQPRIHPGKPEANFATPPRTDTAFCGLASYVEEL